MIKFGAMIKKSINIKIIIALIIVQALTGLLFNATSESGISLIRVEKSFVYEDDSQIEEIVNNGNAFVAEIKNISLDQAHKLFTSGDAAFVDARDKWDFAEGHVKGAINIPQYNFDPSSDFVQNLDREELYIIYCNDDDCETSQRLAAELSKLSFKKIYIFEEGWNAWLSSNFPTEKSELK